MSSHSLAEWKVDQPAPLLDWLFAHLQDRSRATVKQILKQGRIAVNDRRVTQFDLALQIGDCVRLMGERASQVRIPIVEMDSHWVIIDKPAGLLSVGDEKEKDDTAFTRLNAELAARHAGRVYVVHRLDRETSGLLLFARSPAIRDQFQSSWSDVIKIYLAIVEGRPPASEGVLESELIEMKSRRVRMASHLEDGKHAITRYRVLASRGGLSLVQTTLVTGRKHQIRVQLADAGCPVIGDDKYGAKSNPARRLGLHSHRLEFHHPVIEKRIRVSSKLPTELNRLVPNYSAETEIEP